MSFRITWLGHNAFSLDIDGCIVLIDPFLTGNPAASVEAAEVSADFILVSHGHDDHIGDTVAIARRTGARVVSNWEVGAWVEGHGVTNLHRQHVGGGYHHPFGYVKFTIAHHGSSMPDGTYGGNPSGFLITAKDGKRAYFACDTALFSDMQLYAGADFAALPIGDNFTMGPDDAFSAVTFLRPKVVMPCHFSTFPLIEQDGQGWVERVNRETDARAVLLRPGEGLEI